MSYNCPRCSARSIQLQKVGKCEHCSYSKVEQEGYLKASYTKCRDCRAVWVLKTSSSGLCQICENERREKREFEELSTLVVDPREFQAK